MTRQSVGNRPITGCFPLAKINSMYGHDKKLCFMTLFVFNFYPFSLKNQVVRNRQYIVVYLENTILGRLHYAFFVRAGSLLRFQWSWAITKLQDPVVVE